MIPDAIRPRLGKILRMLTSDEMGDQLAAVGALRNALAGAGVGMHDLAAEIEEGRSVRPPAPATAPSTPTYTRGEIITVLRFGLDNGFIVDPGEKVFAYDMVERMQRSANFIPSPKQRVWATKICFSIVRRSQHGAKHKVDGASFGD